jgi:mannosyl-oligosaccharide alpha-1,2-mannosidase
MYEDSVEAVKKHLLFRPMTPDNQDILLSGSLVKSDLYDDYLIAEGTHLTCFTGGMLALGAKIFRRPDELELAAKVTEGCVWAYNSTQTGIMPEGFLTVPCANAANCLWNETLYLEALDPYHFAIDESPVVTKPQKVLADKSPKPKQKQKRDSTPQAAGTESHGGASEEKTEKKEQELSPADVLKATAQQAKGEPDPLRPEFDPARAPAPGDDARTPPTATTNTRPRLPLLPDDNFVAPPPISHEAYAKSRIVEERLPPGFVDFQDREYRLR